MKNPIINQIEKHFILDKIFPSEIKLNCSINSLNFSLKNRDIMGGVIQEWFCEYLNSKLIPWSPPAYSQSYPDIILQGNHYLEIKSFHYEGSLAFDLANFKSLIDDLTINAKRLDSDYIIFAYSIQENIGIEKYILKNYWIKKIWEMTTVPIKEGMTEGLISAQVKRGTIVNLRPYRFDKYPQKALPDKKSFLIQLAKTITTFSEQLIKSDTKFKNSEEWMEMVSECYESQTGRSI